MEWPGPGRASTPRRSPITRGAVASLLWRIPGKREACHARAAVFFRRTEVACGTSIRAKKSSPPRRSIGAHRTLYGGLLQSSSSKLGETGSVQRGSAADLLDSKYCRKAAAAVWPPGLGEGAARIATPRASRHQQHWLQQRMNLKPLLTAVGCNTYRSRSAPGAWMMVAALLLPSCGKVADSRSRVDSESHFLGCSSDADCGGTPCSGGVCVDADAPTPLEHVNQR